MMESDSQFAPLSQPQWLHPTSILFSLLSTIRQFAVAAIFGIFLAGTGNQFALIGAGIALVITAISAVLRYVTLKYQLTDGELRIDEGLIFRRHRVIPAARIQNLDLIQNPIHHLFKVAEARIETAGGSEPEASLRVLSLADIDKLRTAIFAERVKQTPATSGEVVADPEATTSDTLVASSAQAIGGRLLHRISTWELVYAGLISNRGFVLIPILLGVAHQLHLFDRDDYARWADALPKDWTTAETITFSLVAILVVIVVLRLFSAAWYILRFFGYRLERFGDDLRVTSGLFTRISATVPRKRIQFISVQQTMLGRWAGLAVIRLETAGGAGNGNSEEATTSAARRWFVPVIRQSKVREVLSELRDDLDLEAVTLQWRPTAPGTWRRLSRLAIIEALMVAGIGAMLYWPWGMLSGIPAAACLLWFARRYARSLKFAATERWVVFRSGILVRKTSVTFPDKVQSVALQQSPFDRRWQMATLNVDTAAAGPARHRIRVRYLQVSVACLEAERLAKLANA